MMLFYQLLATVDTDTELKRLVKIQIYKAVNKGSKEDLLLFTKIRVIPVDYRYQILNLSDKNFMLEHNLTEDQMKKMKALSFFMRMKGGS